MILKRQKRLISLLEALGGDLPGLDFQKLLFLYCQESEEIPTYEFVPYRYGGFSFTSYADKRRLIERGLLAKDDHAWILTQAGRSMGAMTRPERQRMEEFARQHAGLHGDRLVVEAYRRHPYYAIRSEIAESVLTGEKDTLAAVAAARPALGPPGICTIGYERRTFEGYLNILIRHGVTLLCDVRRNPLSRKYGFSKSTLSRACGGLGIRYEHLPELGIDSEDRRGLKCQADYDALFAVYTREKLPRQKQTLEKIKRWVEEGERVALTCYERLPEQCHRHCVAEAMEKKGGRSLTPQHL
ncbi:MAG: DUF488 domain-containing protein [bacterium]